MNVTLQRRLPELGEKLGRVTNFRALIVETRHELLQSVGYAHVWLFVADQEDADEVRLVDFAGAMASTAWQVTPTIRAKGDAVVRELMRTREPMVIRDARTDPRTDKTTVERLGNRTVINLPVRVLNKPFGWMGTGTFGSEGCRPPTPEQLEYLVAIANQVAIAAARLGFLETLASLSAAHDAVSIGVVRVDRELRVDPTFRLGSRWLLSPSCPLRVRRGKLATRRPEDAQALQAAVDAALAGRSTTIDFPDSPMTLQITQTGDLRSIGPFVNVVLYPRDRRHILAQAPTAGAGALPRVLQPVARLMADGLSDKEIARELGLELSTARTYATRVMKALGVHGRRRVMLAFSSSAGSDTVGTV